MILGVVFLIVLGFLSYALSRPDTFKIQRSTEINAAPEVIFPLINDLHAWEAWSPWEKLDPALKRKHSGAAMGKGAVYEWEGNSKVGQGRMEIIESQPSSLVTIKLNFIRPFSAENNAEFSLDDHRGSATHVTWSMTGRNPTTMKIMGLFINMDKLIGKDFEAGLADMKAAAEKRSGALEAMNRDSRT